MTPQDWYTLLQQFRAIAVIRAPHFESGYQMAKAAAAGGIRLIEIAWNSDRAPALIQKLRLHLPHCTIGAGTLLQEAHLQEAIAAGAQFLFTPHVATNLIEFATAQNVPITPGALSPTEIVSAWQAGASSVKVFPVQALGGAAYIQSLQAPLGHIPLIPTGGVTLDNAAELLTAGAIAVGLSGNLFPKQAVVEGNWDAIAQQAKTLVQRLAIPSARR
ncbi:MAG: bifunctional 4-hydroxy-2-oxoglutarate aldolase/2-dehydro-3-deoxy-phosphogluconate aldolase [Tildeniella nuda ZEHNDER 1965/U140]|jgi:2-dehydro-3-deoxyphosphogluconate aldolase/(4S)-4-hydroxy-2-oxoglutarate aldolase|nr:bifunctional 4-hydroxy-2-oxoglutarate aldolase/2-dehydro-3-deoxy-phosphogluconate aldolase [Tildeniella nuda ZEHNDER 1965/U140]